MPLVNIICPYCGTEFRWDCIGTHDECPGFGCRKQVMCIENFSTHDQLEYFKAHFISRGIDISHLKLSVSPFAVE